MGYPKTLSPGHDPGEFLCSVIFLSNVQDPQWPHCSTLLFLPLSLLVRSMNNFDHLRTQDNVIWARENCHNLLNICSLFRSTSHFKLFALKQELKAWSSRVPIITVLVCRHLQTLAVKPTGIMGLISKPELNDGTCWFKMASWTVKFSLKFFKRIKFILWMLSFLFQNMSLIVLHNPKYSKQRVRGKSTPSEIH